MKEQGLVTSTLILTLTSFFTRTLSMISIVNLSAVLGTEGMGLYHLITSVYMIAIVLASAGISVSVSKLIAEELGQKHLKNVKQVMQVSLSFTITLSIIISISFFSCAPLLAQIFIQDLRAILALRILSISIPFIACSSCFKGYFYATKKASLPASGEVIEQIVKVSLTLFILYLKPSDNELYTYGLIGLSLTIGEIVSWSYLLSLYILNQKHITYTLKTPSSKQSLFIKLIKTALPIAAISYVACLFVSAENILIPYGLKQFGASSSRSLSLYGMLKGMVMPILFFPSAFLTAFSTTLIPEIARANVLKDSKRVNYTTGKVLQLTFMLSLLVTGIFINYASEIGVVLYNNNEISSMLRVLSLIVPFMYVEVITDGILKGLGKQVCCLRYSIIDTLFRILTIYIFIPIKGISAFIGIMIISNILTSTLNFNKLVTTTGLKVEVSNWILKPSVAALAGGTFSKFIISTLLHCSFSPNFKLIIEIFLTLVIYISILFSIECLGRKDFLWLKRLTN